MAGFLWVLCDVQESIFIFANKQKQKATKNMPEKRFCLKDSSFNLGDFQG